MFLILALLFSYTLIDILSSYYKRIDIVLVCLLGGSILLLIIISTLKNVTYTYYLLIITYPLSGFELIHNPFSLNTFNVLLLIITVGIMINRLFVNELRNRRELKHAFIWFTLLCLSTFTAFVSSGFSLNAFRFLTTFIGIFLLITVTVILMDSPQKVKNTLLCILIIVIIISILTVLKGLNLVPISLLNLINPFGDAYDKTRTFFGHQLLFQRNLAIMDCYGSFGVMLMTVMPFILVDTFKGKLLIKKRLLAFLIYLLFFILLLALQSRSTILAFIFSSCVIFYFMPQIGMDIKRRIIPLTIILLILVLIALNFLHPYIYNVLDRYIAENPKTTLDRISQYSAAINIWKESPLFGTGKGEGLKIAPPLLPHWRAGVLHNVFLRILVYSGLFGFLPFCFIIMQSFYLSYRVIVTTNDRNIQLLGICLLAGLVGGITELNLYGGITDKMFWILIGLIHSSYHLWIRGKLE